jgi:AraC family transcriptional regulator, regulatory protein of adaptative response / DNA-3-methyladenine glycosylase II
MTTLPAGVGHAPHESNGAQYEALKSRDRRFDGVFFVAVRTTRIYCRPVCRARLPKRENCTFYETAAAAERNGYRPCMLCRPELSPGRSRMDASSRIAAAAYERIVAGAMNNRGVGALARELCVGERHLRRSTLTEFGVTPIELAQTQRLLLAKQLLTDTDLPVAQIAYASGFRSLSRFNTLFLERYRLSPTKLRRQRSGTSGGGIRLLLGYRPPYDWEHILTFLRVRAVRGVEYANDVSYSRTLRFGEHSGWITVTHAPEQAAVSVEVSDSLLPALMPVRAAVRSLFDLDAEPDAIARQLRRDHRLGAAVRKRPGLRVPGCVDPFELAVRGVVGQQVSVAAATTVTARMTGHFGDPVAAPFGLERAAVRADVLAAVDPGMIAALGMPLSRARTVVHLAGSVVAGDIDLGPGADIETTKAALRRVPGIGEWTAEYIAMRGLHWPDAFPATDLGIRKALAGVDPALAAEAWRPWRSYAALHLWNSLANGNGP